MRVFVTGATGFVGSAVVSELVGAGHEVVGLARSEGSARRLTDQGARVHRGSIEDLDGLRRAASESDGAIHTAFYHAIGHMPLGARLRVLLGGGPAGIPTRFVMAAVAADRRALATLGEAFGASGRPLVAAFATLAMRTGSTATEDEAPDPSSAGGPRGETESLLKELAVQGVRTSVVRLPPLVHGRGDKGGLTPQLIQNARKKGESAYLGDGGNRWAAVHRLDAARLFRLALEAGRAGSAYHAVAEEGIPFRDVAQAIGARLGAPAVSRPIGEASRRFGFLAPFVPADNPVSSALTQERLGWRPTGPGFLTDLEREDYFAA